MITSRERIARAFDHREGDRVPVDLNGHRSSGIMVQAYIKLRKAIGLPARIPYVYDFIQQLALVDDDVLGVFGADVVELGHDYYKKDDYWKNWELPDGTPVKIPAFIDVKKTSEGNIVSGDYGQVICIQKPGCLFFEQTCFPLSETQDEVFTNLPKDLQQIMWCRLGIMSRFWMWRGLAGRLPMLRGI